MEIHRIPFLEEWGFQVESAAEGRCRCLLEIRPTVINPYGSVHGGITFTLADTGMGIAVFTLLAPGERTTTVEGSIRYLRQALTGRLIAESRVIRRSNHFAITEAEVFDEGGELLSVSGGSYYISRSKT